MSSAVPVCASPAGAAVSLPSPPRAPRRPRRGAGACRLASGRQREADRLLPVLLPRVLAYRKLDSGVRGLRKPGALEELQQAKQGLAAGRTLPFPLGCRASRRRRFLLRLNSIVQWSPACNTLSLLKLFLPRQSLPLHTERTLKVYRPFCRRDAFLCAARLSPPEDLSFPSCASLCFLSPCLASKGLPSGESPR